MKRLFSTRQLPPPPDLYRFVVQLERPEIHVVAVAQRESIVQDERLKDLCKVEDHDPRRTSDVLVVKTGVHDPP